ncbi:MAG: PD-(D/E)XK nuclease family protein [Muribaculum sp.]|nr:PD-(D/E)XK nuclease family protein [Muribaculum sp.]
MKPFLKTVAEAYASRYRDLSLLTFVFPNKRSGTFFIKYLADLLHNDADGPSALLAPEVTTITDLTSDISGRVVDSSIDQLFLLYRCYSDLCLTNPDFKKLNKPQNHDNQSRREIPVSDEKGVDFDRFRAWGETVLSDFSEVDMQLVDPDLIFKNVKDFKEISSNFLTDKQREVMEKYFGYHPVDDKSEKFWRSFASEDTSDGGARKDSKGIQKKFHYLWQVLSPLYKAFNEALDKQGLATSGGSYRLTAEALKKKGAEALRGRKKFIFIGFNALSRSETRIFTELRKLRSTLPGHENEAMADFYWDLGGPLLKGDDNPAARYVAANAVFFPSPEWSKPFIEQSTPSSLPDVRIYAVPSNAAQLKVLGKDLSEFLEQKGKEHKLKSYLRNAQVAVVLPDEKLLQPMLFSLPPDAGNPNLTMGYPLKQTAVVSFISLLRRLQLRQRKDAAGESGFFAEDLRMLLAHPFAQILFGSVRIKKFLKRLDKSHHFVIAADVTSSLSADAPSVLVPLSTKATPIEVIDYLDTTLAAVYAKLSKGNSLLKWKLDGQNIHTYRDALLLLKGCINKYKINLLPATTFILADRLISNQSVPFEGEPLSGLQIMGMLETRALDFDYLFIPSLNERIMPRKARSKTFIPNTIRRAYGMPPANYQESLFAYYFFRLLSRCQHACIYYDSRVGESGSGMSRYLLQLRHIFMKNSETLSEIYCRFNLGRREVTQYPVEKTGVISNLLDEYLDRANEKPNLSASSLSRYASCPARFFYENILHINSDPEPTETIDPATAGTIVHEALMNLYLPDTNLHKRFLDTPRVITSDYIDSIIEDHDGIKRLVHRLINKCHFKEEDNPYRPLRGSAMMMQDGFCRQILNVLEYDRNLTPFRIYGCEVTEQNCTLPLSNGKSVNFRYSIDRIDRAGTGDDTPFRIVDYKTGMVHLSAKSIDDVFNGEFSATNILQLGIYAQMLRNLITKHYPKYIPAITEGIGMEIYNIPRIFGNKVQRVPKIAEEDCQINSNIADEFEERLDQMITEIFNKDIPFRQTTDENTCLYCPLVSLCRR